MKCKCECCGKVSELDDEDHVAALIEFALNFDQVYIPGEPLVLVCDACYKEIMPKAQ